MPSRRHLVLGATASLLAAAAGPARAQGAAIPPDWQLAPPDSPGVSASALDAALSAGTNVPALRSLLVARHGVLIGERYYGGTSAADLLAVNSVTKSVCSMLVGQALHQGKLHSLSQTVGALLPERVGDVPDTPVAAVTLGQILTGTTGIDYHFMTQMRALASAADPVRYVLGLPRQAPAPPALPAWSYNDAAVSLLTPILERAQGLPLEALAQRDLFAPLGIDAFTWQRDQTGHAMAYMGLKLRTRDALKLAWLMADAGRWQGHEVLPSTWVSDSAQPHGATDWRVPPITDTAYGHLWFNGRLNGRPVVWAWGYGAQFALGVPSLQLAVATAATDPHPRDVRAQNTAVMAVVAQVVAAVGQA